MNIKFKYTKLGQMLDVLRAHLYSALIFSFIWLTMVAVWSNTVGGYIFTVIAVISYALSIYSCGERAAKNDKKPYIPGEPDLKKCLYIPALTVFVNLLFVAIYKLTWVLGSDGNSIQTLWAVITNILSFAWFSVFGSLPGMDLGSFSVIGIICAIIVPYLAFFLGYLAGEKNFDLSEVMFGFMYEKKKNKNKNR